MAEGKTTWNWIVNQRYDLLLFIASPLVCFLVVGLHLIFQVPVLIIWWAWVVFFDGPHVFATWVRTYFDRQERQAKAVLLVCSLALFLIPGITVGLDVIVGGRLFFWLFTVVFLLYQWWHVMRQHYGFVVLYQKKNHEPSGKLLNPIDYWFYHLTMLLPFVAVALTHPEFMFASILPKEFQAAALMLPSLIQVIFVALLVAYAVHAARSTQRSGPKLLLIITTVAFPLFVLFYPHYNELPFPLLAAAATLGHNIQYQGIVWHYAANRYHHKDSSAQHFGLAFTLTKNFFFYYVIVLGLTFVYRYTLWALDGSMEFPLLLHTFDYGRIALGENHHLSEIFFGVAMSLSLHHFILDQFIWKLSRDNQLQKDLHLSQATSH